METALTPDTLLEINRQLWSKSHPKEAVLLSYLDPSETPSHAHEDPTGASAPIPPLTSDTLFIYGIGVGSLYNALHLWLREHPDRQAVFFEDDINVLHAFFRTSTAHALLKDPQVDLHYFRLSDKKELEKSLWPFMGKEPQWLVLPSYAQQKPKIAEELHQFLQHDLVNKEAIVDEYLHFGAPFFRNFYLNLPFLEKAYLGTSLRSRFAGVPAIICGAGPSFAKNIDTLRTFSDHALILGGGSALNVLEAAGITPHFGAGIDPNAEQLVRIAGLHTRTFPFFYRHRMYHEALAKMEGKLLYIPGSGGYPTSRWFDQQFGIDEEIELDEGHNIVNFQVEIAKLLGCNPIVFVGMDLAYTGDQRYAPGVVEKKAKPVPKHLGGERVMRTDIHGKPVMTQWMWISESDWISAFAREHPTLRLINCTEGGLGFTGVPNMTLQEAAKTHFPEPRSLDKRVEEALKKCPKTGATKDGIREAMDELKQSLKRSKEHLTILFEENRIMLERITAGESPPPTLQTGLAALSEVELAEECAYEAVLEIFNSVYATCYPYLPGDDEKANQFKKLELLGKKYLFLRDVCEANLHLMPGSREEDIG